MTHRATVGCREVEAALLAATPGRPDVTDSQASSEADAIATHLSGCAACRRLERALDRDVAAIRQHLDATDWLPVANRVFAALPLATPGAHQSAPTGSPASVSPATPASGAPAGHWTLPASRPGPARPATATATASPGSGRAVARAGAVVRAICLLSLGIGLGLGLQQGWPLLWNTRTTETPEIAADSTNEGGFAAPVGDETVPAADGSDRESAAYVPAPGNNPPLIVPGTASGISATQNRATWHSVREAALAVDPLLYPPIPPGSFEAVTVGPITAGQVEVRYTGSGMDLAVRAGGGTAPDGADQAESTVVEAGNAGQRSAATVRGQTATVTIAQDARPSEADAALNDPDRSAALAPGLVVVMTWLEPGTARDASGMVIATMVPYTVTAVGVPVDVVLAFAGSLVPFTDGWDALHETAPGNALLPVPASMPTGFGVAALLGPASTATTGDESGVTWQVASSRPGSDGAADLIVFSAAPTGVAAGDASNEGESTAITIDGTPATLTIAAEADETRGAARTIRWERGGTAYQIDLTGAGITDAEVTALVDGLEMSTVQSGGADTRSAAGPMLPGQLRLVGRASRVGSLVSHRAAVAAADWAA